jgi:hypothetical protein
MRSMILALCLAAPAQAQTACTGLPDALAALAARYAEAPRVSGLMANGQLLIITASEAGGFTVLIVTPEGLACMAASGEGFALTEAPKPGVMN